MKSEFPLRSVPKRGRFGGPRIEAYYADGPRRRMDVFRPRRSTADRGDPILFIIYGGAWRIGSRRFYRFLGGAFARRGFCAAVPDYRLFPSAKIGGALEDCAAALAWIIRHSEALGADPTRIVLFGHSAGACMAMRLSLEHERLERHGIATEAVKAVVGVCGLYGDPTRYPTLEPIFSEEDAKACAPLAVVRAGRVPPPTLLIHGGRDRLTPSRESTRLASAIAMRGGEAVLRLWPKAGHALPIMAFASPTQWAGPAMPDTNAFLRARL